MTLPIVEEYRILGGEDFLEAADTIEALYGALDTVVSEWLCRTSCEDMIDGDPWTEARRALAKARGEA